MRSDTHLIVLGATARQRKSGAGVLVSEGGRIGYSEAAFAALSSYETRVLKKAAPWFDTALRPGGRTHVDAPPGDTKLLLLCMTPRSGSSALSAALKKSAKMGLGGERLNRKNGGPLARLSEDAPFATRRALLDAVIEGSRTDNGIGQIKCDFPQIFPFVADTACLDRLKDAAWVYLTREDVLRQAISRYRGNHTGFWHARSGKTADETSPNAPYDFDAIRQQVRHISEMMGGFERMFASIGVAPIRITYEEVVNDTASATAPIFKAMGIENALDTDLGSSGYSKVASENTEMLRDRYLQDIRERFL